MDIGFLRTSHSPKGTLGWEGQWDCDVSAGTQEFQGHPTVPKRTMGWERQWDCDVSAGTWESLGHLTVPRGLWDGKDSGTVTEGL